MTSANARFGAFEVLKRLAIGGMGEIFLARQTGLKGFERLAIIKTLLPDVQEDEDRVEMFLAEARIAALLNHPNIVQIFDVGEQDGIYYMAMEYVDGDTTGALVRAALKANKHAPWPFVPLISQAARALHYAHHQVGPDGKPLQLVHRDISPQNIMIRRDGVTKVVDFGIAKVASDSARTKTGVIKGKLAYMAPEQLRADVLDGRADLYALGVVAWELLTGRRMFHNVPDVDIFKTILDGQLVKPTAMNPDFPAGLETVVMKSLALDPGQRFQTGLAFAEALDQAFRDAGEPITEPVPTWVEGLIGETVRQRSTTGISTAVKRAAPTPPRGTPSPAARASMVSPAAEQDAAPAMGAFEPARLSDVRTMETSSAVPPMSSLTGDVPAFQPASYSPSSTTHHAAFNTPDHTLADAPRGKPGWVWALAGMLGAVALGAVGVVLLKPSGAVVAPAVTPPVPPPDVRPTPPPPVPPVATTDPVPTPPPPDPKPPVAVQDPPVADPVRKPDGKKPGTKRNDPTPEKKPPVEAAKPAAGGTGWLTLAPKPWANVTLDGKPLGTTPLFKVPVAAGLHDLVLTNEPEGITVKLKVNIRAGEQTTYKKPLR